LGTIAVPLLPQLELDRMLVLMSLLLCYPVAEAITALFHEAQASRTHRLACSVAGAYLLVSPFSASSIVLNRSWDHYTFLSPGVRNLVDAIDTESDGGRAVFSGCVLHELSGGHLGPLGVWAHTPLVASSYAHNIWHYEQVIPKSYIERGDVGISEFLDHMNATLVLAHEPQWRTYFSSKPDRFREVWRGEGFILFKRLGYTSTYTLDGEATDITQTSHSVTLVPQTPHVILKYRYFPFLTADTCKIQPHEAAPELDMIELSACTPGTPVTIRSVGIGSRVFGLGGSQ
jgi:hypothetical protein